VRQSLWDDTNNENAGGRRATIFWLWKAARLLFQERRSSDPTLIGIKGSIKKGYALNFSFNSKIYELAKES
jgi:hypothetical protein